MVAPSGSTATHAVPYPLESDAPWDVPRDLLALATMLDNPGGALFSQVGTLSSLAAAAAATVRWATDKHVALYDDGAALYPLGMGSGIYGDGSDGTVVISSNTTLTRDMFYDTLTVNSGVALTAAGFKLCCRTLLANNGTIGAPGLNAAGATGGAAGAHGNNNGTTGTTGVGGGNSVNNQAQIGGLGGAGGSGGAGAGGGTSQNLGNTAFMGVHDLLTALHNGFVILATGTFLQSTGGMGGSSGAGDNTNTGGGGGGGGGEAVVLARRITGTGTFTVAGGNGGSATAGNTGGGGGGGGGVLWVVAGLLASTITLTVAAGAAGAGHGTGTSGAAGTSGLLVRLAP